MEDRVNKVYERSVKGSGLYEDDRLYLLREWIEFCTESGTDPTLFRKLTNWYNDAIEIGEEGTMKGLKRVLEGDTPQDKITPLDYTFPPAATAVADHTAALVAYYQQFYGPNFDYTNYNSTAANYGPYYGYQWPDATQHGS